MLPVVDAELRQHAEVVDLRDQPAAVESDAFVFRDRIEMVLRHEILQERAVPRFDDEQQIRLRLQLRHTPQTIERQRTVIEKMRSSYR